MPFWREAREAKKLTGNLQDMRQFVYAVNNVGRGILFSYPCELCRHLGDTAYTPYWGVLVSGAITKIL